MLIIECLTSALILETRSNAKNTKPNRLMIVEMNGTGWLMLNHKRFLADT